jgi:hypothetical protein
MQLRRQVLFVSLVAIIAACGSRTGLYTIPSASPGEQLDGKTDALPPIDVLVPPDAPNPCPDGGSTLIYVITSQDVLLSFYPPTATFTTIGTIACPAEDTPFSMAVDHNGNAYVAFDSGRIYLVSTRTAECQPTDRVPTVGTFQNSFGMGFAANIGVDAGVPDADDVFETLYLAGNPNGAVTTSPIVLGSMDTTTFGITTIGTVTPEIFGSELTGTGGGQLFGFYETTPGGATAAVGEIDRTTGQLLAMNALPGVDIASGWAFAFWGGDFYLFTAPDLTDTVVQRFRPSDGTVVQVAATEGLTVVGAGVSTCAPQR